MKNVKVSVIIPTYKRAADLPRAIESVLNQTLTDFELIVVDDNGVNSLDGEETAKVMEKYKTDERVTYIRHEINQNGSAARNTGIRISSGKYLSFLDDDDSYHPNRLMAMFNKMESLNEQWGGCYTGYIKYKNNIVDQTSEERVEGNIFVQTLMRSFYLGSGSNMFFRKTAIDEIGFFDETFKRNQDLEYLIRMSQKYLFAFVDEALLNVYLDIRTVSYSFKQSIEREKRFRERFSSYLSLVDEIQKKEILAMYNIDWIRLCLSRKRLLSALKTFIISKIPIYVYFDYLKYARDRKKRKVCYGFVVHFHKKHTNK